MNILLADDIDGWLDFHQKNLKMFFDKENLNIFSFNSAKECYDFAFNCNEQIDLVITDLQMEPMFNELAGEWLIKNLKTIPSTKNSKYIIISSTYTIEDIKIRTQANGCLKKTSYNQNPLMLKYLLEEILEGNNEVIK